ncbi:MAG: hypothetical protein IK136_02400 [Oscillospiraceae bacterium]|nr:hypothetical protein [Oscillospiraceae bacterium]
MPVGFDRMSVIIDDIIPCHLGIEYVFRYILWRELEALSLRWSDTQSLRWEELERLG